MFNSTVVILMIVVLFLFLMVIGKQKQEIEKLITGADAKNRRIDKLIEEVDKAQVVVRDLKGIVEELVENGFPLLPVETEIVHTLPSLLRENFSTLLQENFSKVITNPDRIKKDIERIRTIKFGEKNDKSV